MDEKRLLCPVCETPVRPTEPVGPPAADQRVPHSASSHSLQPLPGMLKTRRARNVFVAIGFVLGEVASPAGPVIGRDTLSGCVEVRQDAGEVYFQFFQAQGPNGPLVPSTTDYLTVQGPTGSPILWLIKAADETAANEIAYGVIPHGFRQIIPPIGTPARLVPGSEYGVSALTPDIAVGRFKYGEPGVVSCPSSGSLNDVLRKSAEMK